MCGVAACSPMGPNDELLQSLRAAVGPSHVLTDADVRASYETDWTRRWRGEAVAVVRPASTDEVIAVILACAAAGAAIIPQGGNTGLVGGSVPREVAAGPQVVLSTLRLRDLEPVDVLAGEVTVGSGVTLAALQAHAASSGFAFGVDLGARDSATVGGMIATNAGGIHVLRHGLMRAQLRLSVAVLALTTVGLTALPVVLTLVPATRELSVLGIRFPWLVLGVAVYPSAWFLARWYTRQAERLEQDFTEVVESP